MNLGVWWVLSKLPILGLTLRTLALRMRKNPDADET